MSLTPEKRAELREDASDPDAWISVQGVEILGLLDALDERDAEVAQIAEVGAYAAAREEMANARQRSIADLRRARDAIRERDAALAEVERFEATHVDLCSRLGFGNNITEPMADNDTIVEWVGQQSRDANEWQESQLWRIDCAVARHDELDDCYEHDPALKLDRALAEVAVLRERLGAVEALRRDAEVVVETLPTGYCAAHRVASGILAALGEGGGELEVHGEDPTKLGAGLEVDPQ